MVLKGEEKHYSGVEMQDNRGGWRFEETYPAPDTEYLEIPASEMSPSGGTITATNSITMTYGPFEEAVYIAGMPTFHIQLYHILRMVLMDFKMTDGDGLRLGHAVMDYRFHEGGRDGPSLGCVLSSLRKDGIHGMDIYLEAGESIIITMTQTEEDYVPSPASIGIYSLDWSEAT